MGLTPGASRLVRLDLPIELLARIDSLVLSGHGGFASRTDFIVDAAMERLADFPAGSVSQPAPERSLEATPDLVGWAGLPSGDPVAVVQPPEDYGLTLDPPALREPRAPMFGFHNRDFPSLWALGEVARLTAHAPVGQREVVDQVVQEAWRRGETLARDGIVSGDRTLPALFPTNREKQKAAETAFRGFALGEARVSSGAESLTAAGPLFEWRALGARIRHGAVEVALSAPGLALLGSVTGMGPRAPHSALHRRAFFRHLREHAPHDLESFALVVDSVRQGADTRSQLCDVFVHRWPSLTPNEVSTDVAGYVARAREWGLLAPKQAGGRYLLADREIIDRWQGELDE